MLLCRDGVFRGCTAIRASARRLGLQLPGAEFTYVSCQIEGGYGYLEWAARSADAVLHDGGDSYVIADGRIRMQTIHYTLRERNDEQS